MHALRPWGTNVLHMFAVCAFKFLLPACFSSALRSFTSWVVVFLSLSLTSACLVFIVKVLVGY